MAIVSEMSELSVVSFETDKTLYIPGETITVTAKIKNISGTAIKVWSVGIGIDARQFTDSSRAAWYTYPVGGPVTQVSISWAAGATKSFTWAITLDGNALSPFLRYGVRAVPLVMDLVSGTADNLASDTYVSDSVYVINARFNPTIEAFNFARAIDGVPDDEGTNLLTTLKISQAEYGDNYIFNPVCRIQYVPQDGSAEASTIDLTDQIPALITGVTGDASIIADEFSTGLGYDFVIVFGDEYENTMGATDVDRAFANFAQSETGRGVAFGGFPRSTAEKPLTESYYEGRFYEGIHGVNVYSLDEVDTGGKWIDGKPIYRRIMQIELPAAATSYFGAPLVDCDEVVDIKGTFTLNNGRKVSVNYYYSDTYFAWVIVNADNTVEVKSGGRPGKMCVLIDYTKTTD